MTNKKILKRWSTSVQNNYGTPTIALVKGNGIVVTDADGKKYLDFLGGIATNILGHAHPSIVKAVTKQVSTLSHVSNFYAHPVAVELAEKLTSLTGDKGAKVFFCQSGAEANEAAFKLSRRTGKIKVVAAQGAFHGRTMGALSLTGQPSKREPFLPLIKGRLLYTSPSPRDRQSPPPLYPRPRQQSRGASRPSRQSHRSPGGTPGSQDFGYFRGGRLRPGRVY